MSIQPDASYEISAEETINRQDKIIQALIRRADRQNDIGPAAFRAFESAIELQERVEKQTLDLKRAESELESVRYERERTRRSLVEALSSMADAFVLFLDRQLHVTNDHFLNLLPDQAQNFKPGLDVEAFLALIKNSDEFETSDRPFFEIADRLAREQTNLNVVIGLRGDRWHNLNAQHTSEDNILFLFTEITDLVRRNRVEKENLIDFQEDYLKAVFQNMSAGVSTVSASGEIKMFNRKFPELLGLGHDDLPPGTRVDDLFQLLLKRELVRVRELSALYQWEEHLREKGTLRQRVRHSRGAVLDIYANLLPDGSRLIELKDVTLEVRHTETLEESVRERTAELTRANNTLREEYAKKALVEDELRLAKERVEAAMSSKTRFLAAASHDLLQPINAAQLMISTLSETTQGTEFHQMVERLEGSFSSAEQLLRSLLDISRLEAARENEVSVGPVNLGAIIEGIHGDQALLAAQKDIHFDVVSCSATVRSDALYLLRSVQNLVVNALQYTPPGGRVLFGCRRKGDHVELQVWDTGVGISLSDQERVFEEFARAGAPELGGGAGLGLSVVDRACKLLGHRLTLRSKPGVGSVFSIKLELLDGPPPPFGPTVYDTEYESGPLEQIVLVIEDDKDVLFATTRWLEQLGASVMAAGTVHEAIRFVEDMGMPPDIILADYQLENGETGVEAIGKIREMTSVHVPAIMITANRSEGIREAGILNDVTVLTKPVKLARLRRLIKWKTDNSDKGLR